MFDDAATPRGELPEKTFDIHCPMMGGPEYRLNYLKSSCKLRIANWSCKVKACVQRGGEQVKAAPEHVANNRRDRLSLPSERLGGGVVCACGCGREGKHAGRGLIVACYNRWYALEKRGRGSEFGPPVAEPEKEKTRGVCACGCGRKGKLVDGKHIRRCSDRLQKLAEKEQARALPAPRKRSTRRSDAPNLLARAQQEQKLLEQLPGEPIRFTPGAVSLMAAYAVGRRYRAINIPINPYYSLVDQPVAMTTIAALAYQWRKGFDDYADELAAEVS